jgi:hypothetical protein
MGGIRLRHRIPHERRKELHEKKSHLAIIQVLGYFRHHRPKVVTIIRLASRKSDIIES